MLALSCLTVGLVPHAALRTQSLLQAQPLRVARRAPPPQAHAAAIFESSHLATTVQLGMDATVVSDTLLDVGVYGLLALTVGLTLYSVFVTLDEANNKAGGCVDNPRGLPYCTYGVRAPASCVLYAPEAQGSLPRGPEHGPYAVRVPASGAPSHTTNRVVHHTHLTLTLTTGGWLDEARGRDGPEGRRPLELQEEHGIQPDQQRVDAARRERAGDRRR